MDPKYALRALYWILLIVIPPVFGQYLNGFDLLVLSNNFTIVLTIIGIVLVLYGIVLNVVAGRTLRKYGHSHPARRFTQPDRLVRSGIYRCMRHPAQFGLILVGVGANLIVLGPAGVLLSGWIIAAGLLFIICVEEPEARSIFGEEYHLYEEKAPPVSLNIMCIIRHLFE